MKEYAVFVIVIALVAGGFYGTLHGTVFSEVSKAITGISTVIERAVPHE